MMIKPNNGRLMKIKPVQNKRALLLPVAAAMVAGLTSCDRQQVPGSVPNDRPLPPGPPKEAPWQQPLRGEPVQPTPPAPPKDEP